jgi:site-specific DNA recombinase
LSVSDSLGVEAAISRHFASVRLDSAFHNDVGAMVAQALQDEVHTNVVVRRELNRRAKELAAKEDALLDLVGDADWPKEKLTARMQQIRREREGVAAQLASAQATVEAGREVFSRGLDMLRQPDTRCTTAWTTMLPRARCSRPSSESSTWMLKTTDM